jgi:hypothetical protein
VDPDPDWEFGSRQAPMPKQSPKKEKFENSMLKELFGGLDASSVS